MVFLRYDNSKSTLETYLEIVYVNKNYITVTFKKTFIKLLGTFTIRIKRQLPLIESRCKTKEIGLG